MTKQQVLKLILVFIPLTALLVLLELVFMIPSVELFFADWFNSSAGWTMYLAVWFLMFLQGTILNIPGVTILQLSYLAGLDLLSPWYLIAYLSGSLTACIAAYWLGRKFGTKAVKWIAGDTEEFNKWTSLVNNKTKWWYFITVLLPIFPDDLICLVMGSLKFDFKFYFFANLIGRFIGTITMILTLQLIGFISGSFPLMLIVWLIALIGEIILYFVLKYKRG
jgi:uncharacterized membrane protein YdjX (TVP38/TMEM64 family)